MSSHLKTSPFGVKESKCAHHKISKSKQYVNDNHSMYFKLTTSQ